MGNIKISICMPTRNRAGFIGEALESIISQAGDNVEIVIVDGASTDNTQDVVSEYQKKFKNLVYFRQEENGGVDRDMAKAITLSRGEYCWLFSDDDALKPGAIERILKEIESGYEIYLCNITACNLSMKPFKEMSWLSREIGDKVFNLHDKNELIEYCNKANSIGALFSYWSSIILRREVWIRSGYDYDFDNSAYALAATLFSSIGRTCRLKYIRDSLVLWRNDNKSFQHEGGLAKRFLLDFDAYLHLADKYLLFEPDARVSFLRVMQREHPWYTIIHALSHIDSKELWVEFKAKLLKFGYNSRMAQICYSLSRFKRIVAIGVKIKRAIVKKQCLNKAVHWLCSAGRYSYKQTLQITPIFNYLLIFNIFGGAFTVFRQPFEFYLGYVFIIVFLVVYIYRYRSASINANFLILLIIFTVISLVNVYLGNDTVFLMAKQVLGIAITGTAYYLLIKINNYEIDNLFKTYLRVAFIVAAIGIFQEFSYLVGFKIGYDYNWIPMVSKWSCGAGEGLKLLRLNSIFMEPANFAISMAPAFFVSFLDIVNIKSFSFKAKWKSIVIIISYLLTFSAVAYMAVLLSIFLLPRRRKLFSLFIVAILVLIFLFTAYSFLPDIRMRIDDIVAFFRNPHVNLATHMSVYSVVSNAFITFKSFIINPLFGLGLGSHPLSYDKFMSLGVSKGFMQYNYPEVSKGDAGSLFLRLLSEAGLFGIIVVFYFIFRFRLRTNSGHKLQIISSAIFILFLLHLLRQAHYFYSGLFFFVWVYYFTNKIYYKLDAKN